MTAMGEHAPVRERSPPPSRFTRRFALCLIGYFAGCLASSFWVGTLLIMQSPTPPGIGIALETYFAVFLMTGLFASHSAPVLILVGEIFKWRSSLVYVGLAVLAAFISYVSWIEITLPSLSDTALVGGAGLFSGLAFWLVGVRGQRPEKAPDDR